MKEKNEGSWVALHERMEHHWLAETPEYYMWYTFILFHVRFNESDYNLHGKSISVKRGSVVKTKRDWRLIFGGKKMIGKVKLNNFFKLLVSTNMVTIKVIKNGSMSKTLLTVINYDYYQGNNITQTVDGTVDGTVDQSTIPPSIKERDVESIINNTLHAHTHDSSYATNASTHTGSHTHTREGLAEEMKNKKLIQNQINQVRIKWNEVFIHNQVKSLKRYDKEKVEDLISAYGFETVKLQIQKLRNLPVTQKNDNVAKNMCKFVFFIKPDKFKKIIDGDYTDEEQPLVYIEEKGEIKKPGKHDWRWKK